MITIHHGDIVHDDIGIGPIDSLIVDPPYSRRVHTKAVSASAKGRGPRKRNLGFNHLSPELMAAIAKMASTVSRWAVVFSDIESGHLWRQAVGLDHIRSVPWVRWSQPQLSGDRPPSGAELVTILHKRGRKRWNGPGSLTSFTAKSVRGANKYSCEKPLDLMLSLVSWFSDVGETVCDPTCGAGTTGLACKLLGRNAVLVDRNEDALAVANARCHGDLSSRDVERAQRWVEFQREWLAHGSPTTLAGEERYRRATVDTDMVEQAVGALVLEVA